VEKYPAGYPRLAAFVASEPNLMQFRGFRTVRARLLLHLQTEIQALEDKLFDLDRAHSGDARLRSDGKDKVE
jgi:hypothetical protein